MSQTEDLERDIEELERALEQLDLVHQCVEAIRSRLRRREQRRPRQGSQRRTRRIPERDAEVLTERTCEQRSHTREDQVHPSVELRVGDMVRIDNPREFQQDSGTVVGFQGRFIEVRTQNRNIVRRIPRNLTLLRRGTNP